MTGRGTKEQQHDGKRCAGSRPRPAATRPVDAPSRAPATPTPGERPKAVRAGDVVRVDPSVPGVAPDEEFTVEQVVAERTSSLTGRTIPEQVWVRDVNQAARAFYMTDVVAVVGRKPDAEEAA